jgi:hypothetical protein
MSRVGTGSARGDRSPIASPMGYASADANTPVRGAQRPLAVPKDPASGVSLSNSDSAARSPHSRRLGRHQLDAVAAGLAARDWQVLRRIDEHGYLSTEQVQRFVFTDHASLATASRSTRRVLTRLERDGLLRSLPRRQGGVLGGSTPATWQLAPAGARLLREKATHYRVSTPSIRHLRHCLAIADTHLAIRDHAETVELDAIVDVEPACWRTYPGSGGEQRWLKPDLAATLIGTDSHGRYDDRWFIEVDLGTESLPTLLRKCAQYETYRSTGIEQSEHGAMPLVLWVFLGDARGEQLRDAVKRRGRLTTELFRFASLDTLATVMSEVSS